MSKRAGVGISEQPGYLGNRQVWLLQIAFGKFESKIIEDVKKRYVLLSKTTLESSDAHSEASGNLR